ncbi:hypothetical protein B0H19DRAFT_886856, partial [Mycena capillaripes]
HNDIEHDASVVHLDCPASIEIQQSLVDDFAAHVMKAVSAAAGRNVAEADVVVTEHEMALTRIRREKLLFPLNSFHANIACGELAAVLGVWNKTVDRKEAVPLSWIRMLFAKERLPDGRSPDHVETLCTAMKSMRAMKAEMKKIQDEVAAA